MKPRLNSAKESHMRFCIALTRRAQMRAVLRRRLLVAAGIGLAILAGAVFPAPRLSADLMGTDGLLRISSAGVLPRGGWTAGLFGQYYRRMTPNAHSVSESYALGNLSGRYGFTDLLEAFVVMPGEGTAWKFKPLPDREEYDENHGGPGDMRIGVKMKAPLESETYSLALMVEASLPTGKSDEIFMPGAATGQKLFTTDEANVFGRVCATFDLSEVAAIAPLRVHLNAGYWLNRDENIVRFPSYMFPLPGKLDNKDVILAGLGLEFPSSRVTLFTEFYTEQLVDGADLASFKENPVLITPGAKMNLPFGIVATAALDLRLSRNDADTDFNPEDELPEWAFTLGFDFMPALFAGDMDEDGIADDSDLCPTDPEDIDAFEDADGCPDSDNDQDGVADVVDKCPNQAETVNGYMDADGCPEPDADKDGVTDSSDKCPGEREDRDGYQDDDGCADIDNDGDGVLDVSDACPNEPETVNGYEDADGCPDQTPRIEETDLDTDHDGVPNSKDKCPSLAEDVDGYQDLDGCPDVDNDLDGIIDAEDKCPGDAEDVDGVMDDDGCPDR